MVASTRRIDVQIEFNGPSPFVINANGTFDKRLSLINLARLIRNTDHGGQYRPQKATTVVAIPSLTQATGTVTPTGVAAADTVTIAGAALTATQKRATGTVTLATVVAGNTVTIAGQLFTAVSGAVVPGAATFDISGGNTTGATSLAAQVNAYGPLKGVVQATSAAAIVTLAAANVGVTGNSYALASSGGTLTLSGATLTGGAAASNNTFDPLGTNAQTGALLQKAIAASTTAALKALNATVTTAGVVTVAAKVPGAAGNAITLVSSNGTRLPVSGAGTLTGGVTGTPTQWTF